MPLAAFIAGVCFFAIAGIHAVWQFYIAYIIARAIANPMLVGVVPRTAAVNFFSRRRNLALGISAMARPFGGAINIQVFSLIAIATSWRAAFRVHGAISLLIVIPLLLIMRRRPSDIGLRADGASDAPLTARRGQGGGRGQATASAQRDEPDWGAGQAAGTSAFWLIVAAEALVILISGTINFQIVPYLRDVGISPAVAAGALSVSSLLGSLGNPFWGWLADIFSPRRLALITLAISGAAVSLFIIVPEGRLSVGVVILYGSLAGGLNILGAHDDSAVFRQVVVRLNHGADGAISDGSARSWAYARRAALPHHRRIPHHIPVRRAILHLGRSSASSRRDRRTDGATNYPVYPVHPCKFH